MDLVKYGIPSKISIPSSYTIKDMCTIASKYDLFYMYTSESNPYNDAGSKKLPSYGSGLCLRCVKVNNDRYFIHCLFWDDDHADFGCITATDVSGDTLFYKLNYYSLWYY